LAKDTPLPLAEIIEKIIKTETKNLSGISDKLKSSQNATSLAKELYHQSEKMQTELADAEKKYAGAEERKNNLAEGIAEGREKQKKLLASVLKEIPVFSGETSAAGILATTDKLIAEKEKQTALLKEKREKAIVQLSGAKAAWESSSQNRSDSAAHLANARASLEKALCETCFTNSEQAEEALLDTQTETALENEIRQWRENRKGLETRIAEQEKQLENIRRELAGCIPSDCHPLGCITSETNAIPNLEDAQNRLEKLKTERAIAEENKNKAYSALQNLSKDKEALEEAKKRRDDLTVRAGKLKRLSDDLSGKNSQSLPFDSWLLRYYLNEAAVYANIRLKKMSDSRYSLLLDTERQQSRGYAGLDLLVFDSHTGKTRPCATLSGGESFMASVSLALGLADSIQNRSGGVRLDAVFIDEGFGSLDETSLDKALVILDELRDSRMVGLISHVGELRSRIPCRVEVEKTSTGSRIRV
jgi:exonuclease SbcC